MKKFILFLIGIVCINLEMRAQENESSAGKFIFSNKPENNTANIKTSFSSSEYIYASMDLGGKTVKEFFKMPDLNEGEFSYLYHSVEVYLGDKWVGETAWRFIMVTDEDKEKNVLPFDVLPEPGKTPTMLVSASENFKTGLSTGPLYSLLARKLFEKSGSYKIVVTVYNVTKDAYGKVNNKGKWPTCSGSFSFIFKEEDVPVLLKNRIAAEEFTRNNAIRVSKLPSAFTNPLAPKDPKLSKAKIAAILKRDVGSKITKFAIEKEEGSLWAIAKNNFGIPRYRYLIPRVFIVSKNGEKCYITVVELIEEYLGGGKYGTLKVGYFRHSEGGRIECEKVK